MAYSSPTTATIHQRHSLVLTPLGLNAIVSTYIMVVFNTVFWDHLGRIFKNDPFHVILFGAAIWMLTLFTLSLFSVPRLHRPVMMVVLLISAGAAWYQDQMGIVIDKLMVQNIMNTTFNESKHLITGNYIKHMLLTGVLPSVLIWVPRIKYPPFRHLLWKAPLTALVSFVLAFGFLFVDLRANASAIREHHELMSAYQPGATIGAVLRYAKMQYRSTHVTVADLGNDAVKGPLLTAADKPVLTVLFLGETARAQNFGLDGYARDTTPELAKHDIVNYTDASSCGTSTAVSLPCMFSPFPKSDFSFQKFMSSQNLLDVLAHAGVDPVWWDNNTGDQYIATRTGSNHIDVAFDPVACAVGECTDEVLLTKLAEALKTVDKDTVVVLHMVGSHGPTYHLRYPREFAKFLPDCQTAELQKCSSEEIVNAYDNTMLYSDHILGRAIDMLAGQDRVISSMFYLSDHGESLGENGLYLHAAPSFLAPETQTKVPYLIWLSDAYQKEMGVSMGCLRNAAHTPVSQDNFFHTVLGLMDITTDVRDPALDLTTDCRAKVVIAKD